jgi:voltage-gated potassium channel
VKSQPGAESFVSRYRFILLFGVLLVFYVLTPVLHQLRQGLPPAVPVVVEGMLFLALLLGTVVSVSKRRAWIPFALLLALPAAGLWFVGAVRDSGAVDVIRHLLLIAFLGYVIGVMLGAIFESRQVTYNTVCASLCIYLLLGLVWALAYTVVGVLDPAAFTCTVDAAKHPAWMRVGRGETAVLYFSFSTLTTLGYGDIVPTSPISRMLASVEAITGQLYLAVLVARLVGMHIVYSMARDQARGHEPRDGR